MSGIAVAGDAAYVTGRQRHHGWRGYIFVYVSLAFHQISRAPEFISKKKTCEPHQAFAEEHQLKRG